MSRELIRDTLDPDIMRQVALGMADGQLAQADLWLLRHEGRAPRPRHIRPRSSDLVLALEHMRSGHGWLTKAARLDAA